MATTNKEVESYNKSLLEAVCMAGAQLESLLVEVCNEYMEADDSGRFVGCRLAEKVNKILGL